MGGKLLPAAIPFPFTEIFSAMCKCGTGGEAFQLKKKKTLHTSILPFTHTLDKHSSSLTEGRKRLRISEKKKVKSSLERQLLAQQRQLQGSRRLHGSEWVFQEGLNGDTKS